MAAWAAGPGGGDPLPGAGVTEGEHSAHTMIALYLDVDLAQALHELAGGDWHVDEPGDGATPVAELHVTVAYTGRTDTVDVTALRAAAEAVTGREPIAASVNGIARFAGGPDQPDVLVALVDSPGLERLRRDLVDELAAQGVELDATHGYTAHITLAYLERDDPGPIAAPVRMDPLETVFTVLTVKYGDEIVPYGFDPTRAATSTAETALAAYLDGWARTGAPLTDRVHAGALAAVALAEEDPGRPGLLEATLQLGAMEGTWAMVFDRRDALHGTTKAAALKLWADLVAGVDTATLVDDVQDAAASYDGTPEHRGALSRVAGGYLLGALRALQHEPRWEELRTLLQGAIADAAAEGWADALALAAEQAGHPEFDWQAAHADALGLHGGGSPEDHQAAADTALHAAVDATAATVGRRLVSKAVAGDDSTAELVAFTDRELATGDLLSLEVIHALDVAVAGAMWGLFQRAGIDKVNFVTVGDGRVCAACTEAESHNPYPIFDAPILPLHYGCRCSIDSAGQLAAALWSGYVLVA